MFICDITYASAVSGISIKNTENGQEQASIWGGQEPLASKGISCVSNDYCPLPIGIFIMIISCFLLYSYEIIIIIIWIDYIDTVCSLPYHAMWL
jgi:hypothetical protein